MNHRRPNFDELTPDDLFRPEPVDGPRTGGTIAGEVLYSSREPIPPAQPQQASGQPEYFGDATAVAPALSPGGGEGATQFLPPFPQPQPGYDYSGPQGFDQNQGYDQNQQYGQGQAYEQGQGYDQIQGYGQNQGYADPVPYQQQAQQPQQQPSYGHQVSYGQPQTQQQPSQQQSQPQYGGGYSGGTMGGGPGGGGTTGGGRSGSGRRFSNRAIAVAAIAACALIGICAAALMGGSGSPATTAAPAGSVSASASGPVVSESKAQAQALSDLLATAANGRSAVIAAVGNVNACQSLPQSQTDLTTAAGLRKQLIQQLGLLQTGQLANGSELVTELRQGWQASADADTHYAAWAAQSVASCAHTHKPKPGGELALGDAASGTASDAKAKAAKLWNVIARQDGLPVRSGSQL